MIELHLNSKWGRQLTMSPSATRTPIQRRPMHSSHRAHRHRLRRAVFEKMQALYAARRSAKPLDSLKSFSSSEYLYAASEPASPVEAKPLRADHSCVDPSCADPSCASQLHAARILDLNIVPDSKLVSLSLAHCRGLGGFVVAPKLQHIGLDLEPWGRSVSWRVLQKVSSVDEVQRARGVHGRPLFLWLAKEAAFKALRQLKRPRLLSQIQIASWAPPLMSLRCANKIYVFKNFKQKLHSGAPAMRASEFTDSIFEDINLIGTSQALKPLWTFEFYFQSCIQQGPNYMGHGCIAHLPGHYAMALAVC